jgi:hypothetical protein
MFKKPQKSTDKNIKDILLRLIDIAKTDTVFRDIYLHRARNLFSDIFPSGEYRGLAQERALGAKLPDKINIAIEKGDWEAAKELAERAEEIKEEIEEKHTLLDIGKEVYDGLDDVKISPFLSGLHHLAGASSKSLPDLRDRICKQLKDLQEKDPSYEKLYRSRLEAFSSIPLADGKDGTSVTNTMDETELRQEAEQALKSGDMVRLEKVAALLLEKKNAYMKTEAENGPSAPSAKESHPNRIVQFSEKTISNAAHLGLIPARLDESEEYAYLYRFAFHPGFGENPDKVWKKVENSKMLSSFDISDALKRHVELFGNHTIVNSGGSRYFPDFVAENCLVEDFPELPKDGDYGESELLLRLGLENRRGLSRKIIERAVFEKGHAIIKKELGLEPESFCLVCIPLDIFLRLGLSRGWGKQELWTHFDGYEISHKGKVSALVGGDARFGGVYDLVGIGREYESNHVIVRLAIIQRERLMT